LARAKWLADRQAELLPVPYFHVVFTLPAPLGEIALQNKAADYAILFRAAAETLATIAADSRHLGAQLGMTLVLHTWGQTLSESAQAVACSQGRACSTSPPSTSSRNGGLKRSLTPHSIIHGAMPAWSTSTNSGATPIDHL
jgi:hypothetical protein